MSINAITFGSPVYSPAFAVSSGDVGVIKLRSRETAPLSHETLDENFTNLANKINEILGLNTHLISVGTDGKIAFANLSLSAGEGLNVSGTGLFTHGARGSTISGYSSSDLTSANLKFVDALDFDSFGHVKGYKTGTLTFATSGHIGVSNTGNAVTIASSAYGSGDSPSFGTITASNLHLETSTATDILRFGPDGRWGFQRTNDDSRYVSFSRQMNKTAKEVFTIDGDTSYVGIGTGATTPFALLTVQHSVSKVQLEVDPDADRVLISSYNRSGTPAPKPLKFSASAYSFSDGNVGIGTGTETPSEKLDVRGSINLKSGHNLTWDNHGQIAANATQMGFYMADAQIMSIKPDGVGGGKVGISTTNPSTTFDINQPKNDSDGNPLGKDVLMTFSKGETGEATIGLSGGSSQVLLGSLADDLCIRSNGKNIRFGTASATRTDMTIDSNGNVGIGMTEPQKTLDVKGTFAISNSKTSYWDFDRDDSDGSLKIADTGTERVRIDSNGNVGIGALPSYKLDVFTESSVGLRLQNPATSPVNGSNDSPALLFAANGWDTDAGSRGHLGRIRLSGLYSGAADRGNTHPVMVFDLETNENNPDDTASPKMSIGIDAVEIPTKLGIGTTATPSAPLEVVQPTANKYAFMASRADGTRLGVIYQDSNSNGTIGAYNANNEAKVWLNTNGDSYFTGGRVGIGTPVPASDLTIATNASDATFKIGSVLSQNPTDTNYPLFANMTYRSYGDFEIHNNYASGDMEFHVQTGRYIKLNGNVTVGGSEVITAANISNYATGGGVAIGTTATTALAGNTTTITTTQANAIATNSAKVGITTAQTGKLENIEALANNYSLPTATSTVLGGVKIGANLSIDANNVVSVPVATSTSFGVVKVSFSGGTLNISTT